MPITLRDLDFWSKAGSAIQGALAVLTLLAGVALALWRIWRRREAAELRRAYRRAARPAARRAVDEISTLRLKTDSWPAQMLQPRSARWARRWCLRRALRACLREARQFVPFHQIVFLPLADEHADLSTRLCDRLVSGTPDDAARFARMFYETLQPRLSAAAARTTQDRGAAIVAWMQGVKREAVRPRAVPSRPVPLVSGRTTASPVDGSWEPPAAPDRLALEFPAGERRPPPPPMILGWAVVIDMVGSTRTELEVKGPFLQNVRDIALRTPAHRQAAFKQEVILSELTDGLGLIFHGESALGGVDCAVETARGLRALPWDGPRPRVRIGMHCGLFSPLGHVYGREQATGNAIEQAQRVMSCAPPDTIYLSAHAAEQLRNTRWRPQLVDVGLVEAPKGDPVMMVRLDDEIAIDARPPSAPPQPQVPSPIEAYLRFVSERDSWVRTHAGDLRALSAALSMESAHARRELEYIGGSASDAPWATRTWTLEELVDEAFRTPGGRGRRWHLIADPGSGKTSELRHLSWTLARRAFAEHVPAFTTLARLARQSQPFLPSVVNDTPFTKGVRRRLSRDLDAIADRGRMVFLLDGLDEVPVARRDRADDLVAGLLAAYPASVVILSSRELGVSPRHGFQHVRLLPLDRAARVRLVAAWSAGAIEAERFAEADATIDRLDRSPGLWSHTGNPLYLTLLAALRRSGRPEADSLLDLHLEVVDVLLRAELKPGGRALKNPVTARSALELIAHTMTAHGHLAAHRGRLANWLESDAALAVRIKCDWDTIDALLTDLSEISGIIGPYDGSSEWRFLHPAMRDAVAAAGLQTELEETAQTLRRERRDGHDRHEWWTLLAQRANDLHSTTESEAEVYALLAAHASDQDALVQAFARADSALGQRALIAAPRVSADTIREVLKLSTDWQRRRVVIDRLADANTPDRALDLLERVRQCVTTGNDLFFVRRAVLRCARSTKELARHAAQIADHVFDNIPRPDAALFQTIPRPGRAAFWVDIPAGVVPIEGSHSAPAPATVRVRAPFRLAAVPITVAQYCRFDPSRAKLGHEDHPITNVTWFEAMMFCAWLGQLPAFRGARLPCHAEYVYACQGEEPWWTVPALGQHAWNARNSERKLQPVATLRASPRGLFDLLGNANGWCLDLWTPDASPRPDVDHDPASVAIVDDPDTQRTFFGGSFLSAPDEIHPSHRFRAAALLASPTLGFRVVLPTPSSGAGDTP